MTNTAHLRPIPTEPGALLRYRCPADAGGDDVSHLAFDVRLPVLAKALRRLPTRCICGAWLHHWMDGHSETWPSQTDGGGP